MTKETNPNTEAQVQGQAQPELKQILGALLFAARKQTSIGELRGILEQVAQNGEEAGRPFAKIKDADIRAALEQIKVEMAGQKLGIILMEVAGGFRLQTDPAGGPWVRQLLNLDKPAHLSKPALETLAIIAYRQPITRAEIEALRGVNVDAMMRHLLELQLIRIMGRSDLAGRPLMYGTTQLFLEHFGLSSVNNLPGIEQLSRRDAEHVRREKMAQAAPAANGAEKTDSGQQTTEVDLPSAAPGAKEGGQTADGGKEENAEHPTSNAQRRMKTEEQKTEDDGGQTTDDGRQTPEDKITEGEGKEENAEHPTSNAQRRMKTEEQKTEEGEDSADRDAKDTDQSDSEESDDEEEEYDDEDEDEDEDEDDEDEDDKDK